VSARPRHLPAARRTIAAVLTVGDGTPAAAGSAPKSAWWSPWLRPDRAALWGAALVVLVIGLAVFSRGDIDGNLSRDESIYTYAGQQLALGVPPYVSILDPKTPLSSFIAGAAVTVARALDVSDLHAIRLTFFVISALAVVAVFVAGLALFGTAAAAVAGAAAFLTFRGFAIDALGGPDAKTPGVLFAALCTWLLVRRRWFLAGLSAGLAVLVWQPLGVYCLTALLAAWLGSGHGLRMRAVAGATAGVLLPIVVLSLYFLAAGALGQFWEGAVLLPVTGTERVPEDFGTHVAHMIDTVLLGYGAGGWVMLAGLAATMLLAAGTILGMRRSPGALARQPIIAVVMPPLLGITAFSLVDFQGYPDVFPFLIYGALGIAGVVAVLLRQLDRWSGRSAPGVALAGVLVLGTVVATLVLASEDRHDLQSLPQQQADAHMAEAYLLPGDAVMSLGDPTPLVLMRRTSVSRFIYLGAGVDRWVVAHLPGGFAGWTSTIAAAHPRRVFVGTWHGEYRAPMFRWLRRHAYRLTRIGELNLFILRGSRPLAGALPATELVR
jgi:hypothetical protein